MSTDQKRSPAAPNARRSYWQENLSLVGVLLLVWLIAGFGCGILGIEFLNRVQVGQIGFGFWMAQQGSIFVFVVIVAAYAWLMDRLDKKHGTGEKD